MKIVLTTILFIVISFGEVFSVGYDDCKSLLKEIIQKNAFAPPQKKNEIHYISFTVKTTLQEKHEPEQKEHIENFNIYIGHKSTHVISDNLLMYTGDKSALVVYLLNKTIMWVDLPEGQRAMVSDNFDKYIELQKEIIDQSKVILCKNIRNESDADKLILIRPEKSIAEKHAVKNIAYYINTKEKEFTRVVIHYTDKKYLTKKTEIIYNQLDFNYKGYSINNNIESYIFQRGNILLSKYKNFELIDSRNKNK
jgi:hypothetical protein